MLENLIFVVFVIFGLITLIDLFFSDRIPAVLTSTFLFVIVASLLYVEAYGNILFGILGFIFALILYEFQYITGKADIKVITGLSMLMLNMNYLFIFIASVVVFGLFYKVGLRYLLKVEEENIPFIPSLFLIFIGMITVGGTL